MLVEQAMGERKRLSRGECEGAVGRKVVTESLCICWSAHQWVQPTAMVNRTILRQTLTM